MFFVYDEMCEVLLCDVVYKSLMHGTVFLSSSPTAHLLAPLENISRPTYMYFHYYFRTQNSSLL